MQKSFCVLIFTLTVLMLVASDCIGPVAAPPASPSPADVGTVAVASQVQRVQPVVWAGSASENPLPRLIDENWHNLLAGSRVTTDDAGDGWIKFASCTEIHVFRKGALTTSACPKSTSTSGNTVCTQDGTTSFKNNCAGGIVIQTPSAQITLEGTWLTVSYQPDLQTTEVLVIQGTVTVTPIVNADTWELGPAATLQPGDLYFTMPDNRLQPKGQFEPRTVIQLDSVTREVLQRDFFVGPWLDPIYQRASEDLGNPNLIPAPIRPPSTMINLGSTMAGGPLADTRVSDALLQSVQWGQVRNAFGKDIQLRLADRNLNAQNLEFNPSQLTSALRAAGYNQRLTVQILIPTGNDQLESAARQLGEQLKANQVEAVIEAVSPAETLQVFQSRAAAGQPVWLLQMP
jgi:hypothetical protein